MHRRNKKIKINDFLITGIFLEIVFISVHRYVYKMPQPLLVLLLGISLFLIIIGLYKGRETE
ncbi:MAG: hypothetical protein Q4G11_00555 [Gallicola sp.]|nr:hypothetical protein [Gallicola sp.]